MADQLTDFLIMQNFSATAIHGDRSQAERERALAAFRSGRANILVATAVAARGLDIPNVTHVINYDLPSDVDDYVHRIGRTGRAGNTGVATAFFNRDNNNIVKGLYEILEEANQEIPPFLEDCLREVSFSRSGSNRSTRGNRSSNTRDYRKHGGNGSFGQNSRNSSWGSARGGGFGGSTGGWGNDRAGGSAGGWGASNTKTSSWW